MFSKTKTGLILAILSFFLVFSFSCSKDKEDKQPSTPKEFLLNGKWKPVQLHYELNSVGYDDNFEDCNKDDFFQFHDNNKVDLNNGTQKCDQDEPNSETFDWELSADNKTLTIDGQEFEVVEINNTTLKLRTTIQDSGQVIKITTTWGH